MKQDDKDPLVVVEGAGSYLMPLSQATVLMTALMRGTRVEYSWQDKCYKFVKDRDTNSITLKGITMAQLAQMNLEE